MLTDLSSTNGTFVDGERVTDEVPLGPGATIRFGEVTTLFESTDDTTGIQARVGTRMMDGLPASLTGATTTSVRPRRGSEASGLPRWAVVALVVVVVGLIVFMLFK